MKKDFTEIQKRFSTKLKRAVASAFEIAESTKKAEVNTLHLLYGIAKQKGSMGEGVLKQKSITSDDIVNELTKELIKDKISRASKPVLGKNALAAVESAAYTAFQGGSRFIGTEHLLHSIVEQDESAAKEFLEKRGINTLETRQNLSALMQNSSRFPSLNNFMRMLSGAMMVEDQQDQLAGDKALRNFCTDITDKTQQGKIDPVIGRENEIERIIHILGRRSKNNPVLLGDAGVGKTAIVEGIAKKIHLGEVPDEIAGRRILVLDLALTVAGSMYRGEFEARLKKIIDEAKKNPDVILFIDEIHSLIGTGNATGSMDAASILKPALARGEIRCIGATTFDEYRKFIEKDAALERRFQPVKVEEPSPEQTMEILKGIKQYYEDYHGISITPEAIESAVRLSHRYIQDRNLPDKAIDLVDEAASKRKIERGLKGIPQRIAKLQMRLAEIFSKKQEAVVRSEYTRALKLRKEEDTANAEIDRLMEEQKSLQTKRRVRIGQREIADIVRRATNIPASELLKTNDRKLISLEKRLGSKIIGQDEAVSEIAKAIRRRLAGISNPKRPIGSFILLGPTGVGKTELAKVLAEEVFESSKSLIRVDMSEFMEKFNVSRLVGAAAGYIGYEEGGKLTEQVRQKPHSVVLFDEIEKAHPDVFNILLQILEEGHLTDNRGREVNFKNTIIIMTSNIGTKDFTTEAKLGFAKDKTKDISETSNYKEIKDNALKELRKTVRPEFLNRIDKSLVFRPLNINDIRKITELEFESIKSRLKEKNIKLSLSTRARNFIAKESFDPEKGARPVRRKLQELVEDKIADALIKGKLQSGDSGTIECDKKLITLSARH